VPVADVETGEVVGGQEEHELRLGHAGETGGVVGEAIAGVGGGGVAEEDAGDLGGIGVRLAGVVSCWFDKGEELGEDGNITYQFGIVAHDIAVAGVCNKHELALGEGQEDLGEQEFANADGGVDVAKVQGTSVEGAWRVVCRDESFVVSCDLLGCGGEVVEVSLRVGECLRPVGVNRRHVHPRRECVCESVEDTLGWLVNLGYSKVKLSDETRYALALL